VKTFYLNRACVRAISFAVALSLATAANLTAQDKTSVVCADGFVAASVAICNASHHGVAPTTIGAPSPTGTDNPFSAATAGLPDAGGNSSKPPVVFTKESGSSSPTIWQRAVTGESPDTASKSGGITNGGGTGPKQPVVLNKELGAASPTIWRSAVTGESLDTTSKSGGITKTTGTELDAFKMGTQSPVDDTQPTKPKGKRQGQPVVVP
jgi:type VI protein secretion system component Hcp